jgi:quercetin dioxygenase-like cupin family protein
MEKNNRMCNPRIFAIIVLLGTLAVAGWRVPTPGLALAQDMPPGAVVVVESDFAPIEPTAPFQVVQMLVELPPNAVVPPHIHGGPAYVTVLAGEVIYWEGDRAEQYGPGGMWIEEPAIPGSAANVGDTTVQLLATYLLPIGAPLTTLVEP